jgi:hypothetical protein
MGRQYDVEVVGSIVVLVVLGTTSEFGVLHLTELSEV